MDVARAVLDGTIVARPQSLNTPSTETSVPQTHLNGSAAPDKDGIEPPRLNSSAQMINKSRTPPSSAILSKQYEATMRDPARGAEAA